jgi:1-acyl-sn-glycerol-3-phosphate acyltransferase
MFLSKPLTDYKPRPKGVRRLLAYLALLLGSLLLKITVKGRHNLPKKGPYVLVCNHFSVIDPAVVIYAHRNPISFLAASDHVIEWYNLWAVWLYGFIPTDRVRLAPSTIKAARQALRDGEVLGIFPEGTSTANELREAKPGAAYLSSIETVKILPISVLGLGDVWAQWSRGLRPRVTVRIGKPFGPYTFPKDRAQREQVLTRVGKEIMCRIAALLPEEHHGVFRGEQAITQYQKENES